jgi:hypothetical protein
MAGRLLSASIVVFVAGCSFADYPFELLSGPQIESDRLKNLQAERADTERVRREMGEPTSVSRDGWTYVVLMRRISVNTGVLQSEVHCQFVRHTHVITFEDSRVSSVMTRSDTWNGQGGKDQDCPSEQAFKKD